MGWNDFWKPSDPQKERYGVCKFCDRVFRKRDNASLELCERHAAQPLGPNSLNIIEKPIYNTLDEAAMEATNIILYHIFSRNDGGEKDSSFFEYCISIYGNDVDTEFCLVETRKGDKGEVHSDYDLKTLEYSFKADVHSHPLRGIHEFSAGDYLLSCGGQRKVVGLEPVLDLSGISPAPHIKYLVGFHKWSETPRYEEGTIVSYHDKFWIAKRCVYILPAIYGPYSGSNDWNEVKLYKEKDSAYRDGAIVFDSGEYDNGVSQDPVRIVDYPIWRREEGHWKTYEIRKHKTLTKFTPPTSLTKCKELAIIMAILSSKDRKNDVEFLKREYPEFQKTIEETLNGKYKSKSDYEIIGYFDVKLEQTDISNVKWKNITEKKGEKKP